MRPYKTSCCTKLKSVHFWLFVLIFLLWQPLCSLKIFVSIFVFAYPENRTCIRKHCLHILYRTEICAILVYSCLILVAMATPLAPSKIQVAYLNLSTPYTLLHMRKIPRFLHRIEICAILAYFCRNLVAIITTPLTPLKIQVAYWNSSTP